MKKAWTLLILGVWVAILPYLGFPYSLKNILFSITGLGIIYLGYLSYNDSKTGEIKEETFDNFSENSGFNENKTDTQEQIDLNKEEIK